MRKNGYFVIDDYIDSRTIKNYMFFPLTINGEEYFFKWIKNEPDSYNELIAEELAKDFDIPCAHYDLASYHEFKGVITKNFVKKSDFFFSAYDLMKRFLPESETKYDSIKYNHLDFYKEHVPSDVFEQIKDMFLFDILLANIDRTESNFGFIKNENGIKLAPLYDHEKILSKSSIVEGFYRLAVDKDDNIREFYRDPLRHKNIVRKFILKYKKEELIKKKLDLIAIENIGGIISRVEDRIEADIPDKKVIETKRLFYENSIKIEKQLYKE